MLQMPLALVFWLISSAVSDNPSICPIGSHGLSSDRHMGRVLASPLKCRGGGKIKESKSGGEKKIAYPTLVRYLAVVNRVSVIGATAVVKNVRYLAYSSEIADTLRPVVAPGMVFVLNGASISYMAVMIGLRINNVSMVTGGEVPPVVRAMLFEVMFQGVFNLLLPAILVRILAVQTHTLIVGHCGIGGVVGGALPTAIGLTVLPFLPRLDKFLLTKLAEVFGVFWPLTKVKETSKAQGRNEGRTPPRKK